MESSTKPCTAKSNRKTKGTPNTFAHRANGSSLRILFLPRPLIIIIEYLFEQLFVPLLPQPFIEVCYATRPRIGAHGRITAYHVQQRIFHFFRRRVLKIFPALFNSHAYAGATCQFRCAATVKMYNRQ